jgi:protein dithiol oxidoreductase (disulfide-forming)
MKRAVLIALSWLLTSFAVHAQTLEAGTHYTPVTPPQASQAPGKIEVVEFFSYGCPHCSDLNPLLKDWAARLPADVSFRRVPVTFGRPAWARLAKIYYALEATGNLSKLDQEVFNAIHGQRVNLMASDDAVMQWVASKGIDTKAFSSAFNGFSINSQVMRGDQETAAFRVSGVPAIAIDGRFMMRNEAATGYAELLKMTDTMIAQVRNEKRKK